MRRFLLVLSAASVALLALGAASAQAEFGLSEFDLTFTGPHGETLTQAGSHPYQMNTSLRFDSVPTGEGGEALEEEPKDILLDQIAGFVGNPTATPRCPSVDFLTPHPTLTSAPDCPDDTAVGVTSVGLANPIDQGTSFFGAVYNLQPPPGVAAKLGFWIERIPVTVELGVAETAPYEVIGGPTNISQVAEVISATFTLWGDPAEESHDALRGHCLDPLFGTSRGKCPAEVPEVPFLTLPRACQGPLLTTYHTDSWQHPGARLPNGRPDPLDPNWVAGSVFTHDEVGTPTGFDGCDELPFGPTTSAETTSHSAQSATGLDFDLDVEDKGLTEPEGRADSDIKKAVITLPAGMSANPAVAEGLGVCSEAQLEAETPFSAPGAGCPEASKIGTVEVESPLLEGEVFKGALFVAKPYENPFNSLLALYMTVKDPERGVGLKLAGKVEPDPDTGQLVATFGDPSSTASAFAELPQLPFSHFRTHIRGDERAPLVTPPGCGSYDVKAELFPWSGGAPKTDTSAFQVTSGPEGGPCPPPGALPFHPGFEAGSAGDAAGQFSPFSMRLTRKDGEQDMTKFSATLPPGLVGKIAGVAKCPDAAIAQAKSRTGPHGGTEEKEHPSCPASSQIGRVLGGAGVGSKLTYVPGSLYLAGPFNGDPLSVVAIVPALAGPFDAGAVVVRVALTLNPTTAEVEVDGAHSDPIPHILKGIPLNVRDLRVYADRPGFTLNPTNCNPFATRASVFGSNLNLLDPSDDVPVGLSAPYQAANCAALGFKPKLAISLKGGTKRGGHPALTATVTPRPGDANFASAVVTLPHSAFLDQAHIRTICTRVQFAAAGGNGEGCPPGSIYGHASATSPLLEETLEGPVYLRSSDHNLPDLVVALHGIVDIDLASRIDSQKGGIRSTFEGIPDAPVTKFVLEMQGAKKGLIVNSTDICRGRHLAKAALTAQNGRLERISPALQGKCTRAKKRKGKHGRRP